MRCAVLACLFCYFASCLAQDDAVVITATRFTDSKRDLPVGVTVITADDLRKTATSNLPEALAQFGLLHVRDASGTPNQQIDLRGFGVTGDQNSVVLLDGVRISENELAPAQLSAIPIENIERIEIVRGSGAVLYGGGATGGTVNIITRRPAPNRTRAYALGRFGGYGTEEARAGLSRSGEVLGLALDVSHEDTDGYRSHNHFRQTNVAATLQAAGERGRAHLRLAGGEQRVELPGALTEAQIAANPRQAGAILGRAERDDGSMTLGGALNAGRHELAGDLAYREKDVTTVFPGFTGDTRVRQSALTPRAKLRFDRLDLTVGADLEQWDYDGLLEGDHTNEALYALANLWIAERTRLVLGARNQRSDQTLGAENARHSLEAYEAALRHGLGGGWSAYAKYGTSFRLATFDELLFNPALLQPQTAEAGELGIELERGGVRGRAAAYDMRLENEIYFSPLLFANVNLPPTRRRGLELEAAWRAARGLELRAALAVLQAEFESGGEVPLVPRAIATAGFSWSFLDTSRLNLNARHVGKQRYDNDQANTFRHQPAYLVVDAKLEHRVERVHLGLELRNLFDKEYYSYGIVVPPSFSAYPQPGRAVFVSLAYRLD